MKKTALVALILCLIVSHACADDISLWENRYKEPAFTIDYSLKPSAYKHVDFKKLLRSAEAYYETPLQFTGKVWGFNPSGDNAIFVIFVDSKQNQALMCFCKDFAHLNWGSGKQVSRFLPDDKVTVYGYVFDVIETDLNEYPFVPLFRAIRITLHE